MEDVRVNKNMGGGWKKVVGGIRSNKVGEDLIRELIKNKIIIPTMRRMQKKKGAEEVEKNGAINIVEYISGKVSCEKVKNKGGGECTLGWVIMESIATIWAFKEVEKAQEGCIGIGRRVLRTLIGEGEYKEYSEMIGKIYEAIDGVRNVALKDKKMPSMKEIGSMSYDVNNKGYKVDMLLRNGEMVVYGYDYKELEDVIGRIENGETIIISKEHGVEFMKAGLRIISGEVREVGGKGIKVLDTIRMVNYVTKELDRVEEDGLMNLEVTYHKEVIRLIESIIIGQVYVKTNYADEIVVSVTRSLVVIIEGGGGRKKFNGELDLDESLYDVYVSCLNVINSELIMKLSRKSIVIVCEIISGMVIDGVVNRKWFVKGLRIIIMKIYSYCVREAGWSISNKELNGLMEMYRCDNEEELKRQVVNCLKELLILENSKMEGDKEMILLPMMKEEFSELVNKPLQEILLDDMNELSLKLLCAELGSDFISFDKNTDDYASIESLICIICDRVYASSKDIENLSLSNEVVVRSIRVIVYLSNIVFSLNSNVSIGGELAEMIVMTIAIALLFKKVQVQEGIMTWIENVLSNEIVSSSQFVDLLLDIVQEKGDDMLYIHDDHQILQECTLALCNLYEKINDDQPRECKFPSSVIAILISIAFFREFTVIITMKENEHLTSKSLIIAYEKVRSCLVENSNSQFLPGLLLSMIKMSNVVTIDDIKTKKSNFFSLITQILLAECNLANQTYFNQIIKPLVYLFIEMVIVNLGELDFLEMIPHKEFCYLLENVIKQEPHLNADSWIPTLNFLLNISLNERISHSYFIRYCKIIKSLSLSPFPQFPCSFHKNNLNLCLPSSTTIDQDSDSLPVIIDQDSDSLPITDIQLFLLKWLERTLSSESSITSHDYQSLKIMEIISIMADDFTNNTNESFMLKLLSFLLVNIPNTNVFTRFSSMNALWIICSNYHQSHNNIVSLISPLLNSLDTGMIIKLIYNQETVKYLSNCFRISYKRLVETIIGYILPKLIIQRDLKFMKVLETISNSNIPSLVVKYLAPIFTEIFLQRNQSSQFPPTPTRDILNTDPTHDVLNVDLTHDPSDNDFAYLMELCGIYRIDMLLRSCLLHLVTLLSVELGNVNKHISARALKSLEYLQSLITNKRPSPFSLTSFMTKYFTGILSYISNEISNGYASIKNSRKLIRSVKELIPIMDPNLPSYTPQIMIIIKKACEVPYTSDIGIDFLSTFINTLHTDQLFDLSSYIFSIIHVNYNHLTPTSKHISKAIIECISSRLIPHKNFKVFQNNLAFFASNEIFKSLNIVPNIPPTSLEFIPQIVSIINYNLSKSCNSLISLIEENIKFLNSIIISNIPQIIHLYHLNITRPQNLSLLHQLHQAIHTIRKTCHVFANNSHKLDAYCCQFLGLIGSIDFNRIFCYYHQPPPDIAFPIDFPVSRTDSSACSADFLIHNHDSSIKFCFHLISNVIGPSYVNTTSAKDQVYLAHAIQELMVLCGLKNQDIPSLKIHDLFDDSTPLKKIKLSSYHDLSPQNPSSQNVDIIPPTNQNHEHDFISYLWSTLPKDIADRIMPLLETNFSITNYHKLPINSPSSSFLLDTLKSSSFSDWLSSWITHIINFTSEPYAKPIFFSLKYVVKILPVDVLQNVATRICLDVVVFGKPDHVQDLITHISSIISTFLSLNPSPHNDNTFSNFKEASNTIFLIFDYLLSWSNVTRKKLLTSFTHPSTKSNSHFTILPDTSSLKDYCLCIDSFFNNSAIDFLQLADAARLSNNLIRAVLYYETFLKFHPLSLSSKNAIYFNLQNIYSSMNLHDHVLGIFEMIHNPPLQHQALKFRTSNDWLSALMCYENMLYSLPDSADVSPSFTAHEGILSTFRNVGQLKTLLTYSLNLAPPPSCNNNLPNFHKHVLEASWRLSDWNIPHLNHDSSTLLSFDGKLYSILLNLNASKFNGVTLILNDMTRSLAKQIGSLFPVNDSTFHTHYHLAHPNSDYVTMCQLHSLHTINSTLSLLNHSTSPSLFSLDTIYEHVKCSIDRLKLISTSFNIRETNLFLNKSLFLILKKFLLKSISDHSHATGNPGPPPDDLIRSLNLIEGQLWLEISKNARKNGYYQTALSAVLHAQSLDTPASHIERAKLMWSQSKPYEAISLLQSFINHPFPTLPDPSKTFKLYSDLPNHLELLNKAHLHLTHWKELTGTGRSESILSSYINIVKSDIHPEKALFYLGRYYNKLYHDHQNDRSPSPLLLIDLSISICTNYAKVISSSDKYYYETMPRLLTLWLDHGARLTIKTNKYSSDKIAKNHFHSEELSKFKQLTALISSLKKDLPSYKFLHAIPQLISRIDHPNLDVSHLIIEIISNVLFVYPHQVLWNIISSYRSSSKVKSSRLRSILDSISHKNSSSIVGTLVKQMINITDILIKLCNMNVKNSSSSLDLDIHFPSINNTFNSTSLIIPLQSSISGDSSYASTIFIPTPLPSEDSSSYNPRYPTIIKFLPEVEVIHSLQRPKKLQILGSDGHTYTFLCKPKDDLRKDYRLTIFNTMINRLLIKNPESRKYKLSIKTYAVTPLDDECGLIEWLSNTVTFRKAMMDVYRSRNIDISQSRIMDVLNRKKNTPVHNFNTLISSIPLLFSEWFKEQFSDPEQWFSARNIYSSSMSAMSIVGYIVGLGDRHGENILLDEFTGSIIHVDFNCLFEKGKTFERPECVPFRLTRNMVDALGPSNVEGVFRKCCETTLSVCKENTEALISVLETLVHELHHSESRAPMKNRRRFPHSKFLNNNPKKSLALSPASSFPSSSSQETTPYNQKALYILSLIRKKLTGCVTASLSASLQLSIKGQVHDLIEQATSVENLSRMYIGWGAYL